MACLGLAFKPDIDDLRESPAVQIAEELISQGYDVITVEPNIEQHERFTLSSLEDALQRADVIAVLVKHRQFANHSGRNQLQTANALDFCGVLG